MQILHTLDRSTSSTVQNLATLYFYQMLQLYHQRGGDSDGPVPTDCQLLHALQTVHQANMLVSGTRRFSISKGSSIASFLATWGEMCSRKLLRIIGIYTIGSGLDSTVSPARVRSIWGERRNCCWSTSWESSWWWESIESGGPTQPSQGSGNMFNQTRLLQTSFEIIY